MCLLGEPTETKVVLGHFGVALAAASRRTGHFIHTAFSEGREQNSILRMREVLDRAARVDPDLGGRRDERLPRRRGDRERRRDRSGGFGWRVSRTPHRTDLFLDVRVPPTKAMAEARRQVLELVRACGRFPDWESKREVYVTAPGAEIDEEHPLVAALDEAHEEVFGAPPERDVTRWFSDASALTRYGVPTVNYGTSSGLLDAVQGREPRDRRARQDGRGLRAALAIGRSLRGAA